jgi:uncharacterized ion transporter superfamily protein YfcC
MKILAPLLLVVLASVFTLFLMHGKFSKPASNIIDEAHKKQIEAIHRMIQKESEKESEKVSFGYGDE